jgi:hypothetical protein
MQSGLTENTNHAKFQMILISSVKIAKYQKRLNKERVASIVKNFDPDRMRPIELSFRNGQYFCFDGQHRLAAYIERCETYIPSMVHTGLTYEQEAYLFARQQVDVGSVTAMNKWNALKEANDPSVIHIREVALKHGYTVGLTKQHCRNINAVKTIQDIVEDNGLDGLDNVLGITRRCWNGARYSISEEMLSGLSLFLKGHSHNPKFSLERLSSVLEVVDPTAVLRESTTKAGANRKERIAKTIYDMYNRKSRRSNRLA